MIRRPPISNVTDPLFPYPPLFRSPWISARLGWLAGGLAFGILPLVVLWFVVFPLKGIPVGGGFTAFGLQQGVVLHVAFGLGLAIFFQIARYLDEGSLSTNVRKLP